MCRGQSLAGMQQPGEPTGVTSSKGKGWLVFKAPSRLTPDLSSSGRVLLRNMTMRPARLAYMALGSRLSICMFPRAKQSRCEAGAAHPLRASSCVKTALMLQGK